MNNKQGLKEMQKQSLLEIVKEHKKNCNGDCKIVLISLVMMAEEVGIQFNSKERKYFL